MKRPGILRLALWPALLVALLLWQAPLHAAGCGLAAQRAEQQAGLPPGLLQAIGEVESGGWPWAVGEAGAGRTFAAPADAIAWVQQRQAAGARSIDVGCFQVNLMYHPAAFASLAEAFDPDSNARAAAAYLLALHARLPAWADVAAAYHSQTPDLGQAYRSRVLARWHAPDAGVAPGSAAATVPIASLRFLPGAAPPEHLPHIWRGGDAGPVAPGLLIRLAR